MPRKPSNCYIIAGPNGAGKTTLGNLFTLYRPLLDTLHFFDNSSDTPRLIFKDAAGQTTINNTALYQRLRKEFAS